MPLGAPLAIAPVSISPAGRDLETRPLVLSEGQGAIGPGAPGSIGSPTPEAGAAAPQTSFEDVFSRLVDGAASADRAADAQVEALAVGASDDIHGTMISVKEAEISLKLVASVRNKLLDAFHELWRTSV